MRGLGYEGKAVAVAKNKELTFEFAAWETDSRGGGTIIA